MMRLQQQQQQQHLLFALFFLFGHFLFFCGNNDAAAAAATQNNKSCREEQCVPNCSCKDMSSAGMCALEYGNWGWAAPVPPDEDVYDNLRPEVRKQNQKQSKAIN